MQEIPSHCTYVGEKSRIHFVEKHDTAREVSGAGGGRGFRRVRLCSCRANHSRTCAHNVQAQPSGRRHQLAAIKPPAFHAYVPCSHTDQHLSASPAATDSCPASALPTATSPQNEILIGCGTRASTGRRSGGRDEPLNPLKIRAVRRQRASTGGQKT